tara:strand:+ start:74 stop:403 length:330 start_codon:yes stop_codon:yes gene_type:complete
MRIGKLVHVYFELICSSNGVSGNSITITLPVAAFISVNAFLAIGTMSLYDGSTVQVYPGLCLQSGTDKVTFSTTRSVNSNSAQYLGVTDFTAALANGDYLSGAFTYESA